jgi:hypothetical protein
MEKNVDRATTLRLGDVVIVAVSLYKCVSYPADKTGSISEKEIHL